MTVPIKYPPPISKNWGFMEWTDIPDKANPNKVYLRRFRFVQTPWGAIYIHWIYEPDTDRDPHDHPWNFWSFILRGGYTEQLYPVPLQTSNFMGMNIGFVSYVRRWRRFSIHKMPTSLAHKIVKAEEGLVTVVFCGRRSKTWGFWTPDGFVEWRDYRDANGVNPPLDEFV